MECPCRGCTDRGEICRKCEKYKAYETVRNAGYVQKYNERSVERSNMERYTVNMHKHQKFKRGELK